MADDKQFSLSGVQLWPTMLFTRQWREHAEHQTHLVRLIEQEKAKQMRSIDSDIAIGAKAGKGLYESGFDFFAFPDEILQRLVQFIRQSLALATSIANPSTASPQDLEITFSDSWYHVTNDGGFHDAHVHHGCSWCGIYYLQVGESGQRESAAAPNGGSRFYCPFQAGGGYRDFGNQYLVSSIDAPLADGLLLLFPSYLLHSGLPYRGEVDRIVLAFNAQVHRQVQRKASPASLVPES
jgi:uncharacterized protein (TIGR02466 family)